MVLKFSRIAILVVLASAQCVAQVDTDSHRRLERGRMGTSALQMRLELLQRLQQIAKDREQRGQPPLDLNRLPKNIRDQIEKVQKQDQQLRKQLEEAQSGQPETGQQSNAPDSPAPQDPGGTRNPNRRDQNGTRRIDPSDSGSISKALEEFQKLQRRNPQRSDQRNRPSQESNRNERRSSPSGEGNASERPLSPNEGFDISKYLDRLGGQSGSRKASRSDKKARRDQSKARSSKSGKSNSSSSEKKPSLRKLWKQATDAGKANPKQFSNQPSRRPSSEQQPDLPSDANQPAPDNKAPDGGGDVASPGEGVFGNALRRTLDGSAEYLGDLAKNYQKPRGGQTAPRNRGGVLRDISRKTGDLFGGSNRSRGGAGGGLSMPEAPSPTSLVPFAIGLAVLGVAWFFMRTLGDSSPSPILAGSIPPPMPKQIDSRQDVIDAFHCIAAESPAVKGNWWTHSRVARALRKIMPQRDDAVGELTRVYETARYLPPDEKLSPQQLQTARAAIERCKL